MPMYLYRVNFTSNRPVFREASFPTVFPAILICQTDRQQRERSHVEKFPLIFSIVSHYSPFLRGNAGWKERSVKSAGCKNRYVE